MGESTSWIAHLLNDRSNGRVEDVLLGRVLVKDLVVLELLSVAFLVAHDDFVRLLVNRCVDLVPILALHWWAHTDKHVNLRGQDAAFVCECVTDYDRGRKR